MMTACPCAQYLNAIIIWLLTLPKRHGISRKPRKKARHACMHAHSAERNIQKSDACYSNAYQTKLYS